MLWSATRERYHSRDCLFSVRQFGRQLVLLDRRSKKDSRYLYSLIDTEDTIRDMGENFDYTFAHLVRKLMYNKYLSRC